MELGKIPGSKLQQLILNKIGYRRKEVLVHAGLGEDSAVVDLEGDLLVISSDPITGASKNAGYLAVHVACNDLAATGAEPLGLQVVLLLPSSTTDNGLETIMEEVVETARSINVEVLGGHTEILSIVTRPIISVTAIGRVKKESYISSSGARPGDDLIVTKGLGIEGTYILANDYEDELLSKGVSRDIIKIARTYGEKLSVIKEGLTGAETGAHAMHDITEGGLYGALDEMCTASGTGFEVYQEKYPVTRETEVICQALKIDPAGLISSGSMLIASSRGGELVEKLQGEGIFSAIIGKVIDEGRFIINSWGEREEFTWSNKDELWRLME